MLFRSWAFVAFFGIVVGVNGAMIWFATQSWTGLATDEAYQKGLDYNANIDQAAAQAALGWSAAVEVALIKDRFDGGIEVTLTDAAGSPVDGASLTAGFERPSDETADFVLPLQPRGTGTYAAPFTLPMVGAWNVHLVARRGDDLYVVDSRHVLR